MLTRVLTDDDECIDTQRPSRVWRSDTSLAVTHRLCVAMMLFSLCCSVRPLSPFSVPIFTAQFYSLKFNPNFPITVTPTSYCWMLPLIPEPPHTVRLTHDTEQVYSCWLQFHVTYMGCVCALQDACRHAQISRYKPALHPSAFVWTCQHLNRGRTYRNIIRLIMTHSAQINTH